MPEPKGLNYQTILAYMSGSLTVEAAINAIAEPIDHAWSNPRVRPGMETDEDSDFVSVEGSLWDLWYGVLHTAKLYTWRDSTAHERLLALVNGFAACQDPLSPASMPKELEGDWIWSSRTLWSELLMLGPRPGRAGTMVRTQRPLWRRFMLGRTRTHLWRG
jgi:hypothetical protein